MSAATVIEAAEQTAPYAVAVRFWEMLGWLGSLVAHRVGAGDAARIDRIALIEKLQAGLEAVKATETVAFAQSQVEQQLAQEVHPSEIGCGIAEQVALAAKASPAEGSHLPHTARDSVVTMPHTPGLLTRREISGWTARLITGQTSHPDPGTRTQVDTAPEGIRT